MKERINKEKGKQKSSIWETLFSLRDAEYAVFQAGILGTVPPEKVIGVRTPELKKLAKSLKASDEAAAFLRQLPHEYFEEDQLHAFLISEMKDFEKCMEETDQFLPYINNWATCDQMSPKVCGKHKEELLSYIRKWLVSGREYTVRYGIGMLMRYYLDEDFAEEYPEMVAAVTSEAYYINMMIAWYFATALAKQHDAVIGYLVDEKLSPWIHNKTIQKAVESRKISEEQKAYLKTLKRK